MRWRTTGVKGWLFVGILGALVVAITFEEGCGMLAVGESAPDFTARLSDGRTIHLTDFAGKKNVVLFFYPKDFTPGCTSEVCAYRDKYREVDSLDAVMFGVSADDSDSHARFIRDNHLQFPLISDPDNSLERSYGVTRLGGIIPYAKRVTYVIDKKGVIRLAAHHEFAIQKHIERVVRTLRDLVNARDAARPG